MVMKNIYIIVLLLGLINVQVFAAADNKSTAGGAFSANATWTDNSRPVAGESIEINGCTVTVTSDELLAFGSITIKNGGKLVVDDLVEITFGALDFSGTTNIVEVSGTMDVSSITVVSKDNIISVFDGGALNVGAGGIILSGAGVDPPDAGLTISNLGIVNVTGNLSANGNSTVVVDGSLGVTGTLNMDGELSGTGSVSAGNYTGSGTIFNSDPNTLVDGKVYINSGGVAVLPIELTSFTVQKNESSVTIYWQTATEENNDFFTIERSADGANYEVITTVQGAGNSFSSLSYSYADNNPLFGVSYYRLKQTDYNGDSETFDPVSMAFLNENAISIGPNPAMDYLKIAVDGEMATSTVDIYNLAGSMVKSIEILQTVSSIDISGLNKGTYLVVLKANSNSITKRIIVE